MQTVWNYGRFAYGSFRLLSVRPRLEVIRLRVVSPTVCIRLTFRLVNLTGYEPVHLGGNSSGVIVKHSWRLSGTAPRRRTVSVGVAGTFFSVFALTSCLKQA